ncbi:hypothetical protein EDB85DRAFT_1890372 [Lactarius pseudohatsudake]|nr:hypothetical protein EDB85DRAFT_1890372 [Lactarius pseudohatsudake]
MFVNQPKQERAKPTCHAVHHLAYVPSLGSDFASQYQEKTGQLLSPTVETHCKHDLMHAVWNHLMDKAFTKGYTQGLVICCTDGTEWSFFSWIIMYTADYPEKLHQRLRIDNEQWCQMVEATHKLIYQKGFAITSKHVQDIMGNHSMVPTRISQHPNIWMQYHSQATREHL